MPPSEEDLAEHVSVSLAGEARGRDVAFIVGTNLKRLRKANGYSLERLAELSRVSRAMLGQIETGRSIPTISVLWKIADALGVPVTGLVATDASTPLVVTRKAQMPLVSSSEGRFERRNLLPVTRNRQTELYEVHIAPAHTEQLELLPDGGAHHLVVMRGSLFLSAGSDLTEALSEGDAATVDASVPARISNTGHETAIAFAVLVRGS